MGMHKYTAAPNFTASRGLMVNADCSFIRQVLFIGSIALFTCH